MELEARMKRSCSFLINKAGKAQGIIIQHRGQLYLLTCHHVIPSRRESFGWHVYTEEWKINLDENTVGKGISCCGEDGILGKFGHFRDDCPFDLDFMLLELNYPNLLSAEFVDVRLSIEALELLQRANGLTGFFQDGNASCFYMRNPSQVSQEVTKKEHYFSFPPLPTGPRQIRVLRDWSFLIPYFKVVKDDDDDICGGGSSGAPMYAAHKSNQPVLIGMHTNHRDDNDDDDDGVDDDNQVNVNDKVPAMQDEFQLTKSFNTNFIWVLHLINLHVYFQKDSWFRGNFPFTEIATNECLLWAVFLRYQKKALMLKKKSLLAKIAQEIYSDLFRGDSQPHLDGEEKEMFHEVQKFLLNYEDSAESLVTGLERASIESLPENGIQSQETSLVLPLQSLATQTAVGKDPVGSETTTGYVSGINNPDSDKIPPEDEASSKDEMV